MTERKFTDEEVIKALDTVSYGGHSCVKCKFKISNGDDRCGLKGCNICRLALDLINRQKTEIERLETENKILSENADTAFQEGLNEAQDLYAEQIKNEIRAEAIKEFADKLKKKIFPFPFAKISEIDNLVKEMTEDKQ